MLFVLLVGHFMLCTFFCADQPCISETPPANENNGPNANLDVNVNTEEEDDDDNDGIVDGPTVLAHVDLARTVRKLYNFFFFRLAFLLTRSINRTEADTL